MIGEYEYGPWVGWNNGQNPPPPSETVQVVMFGALGQLRWENMKSHDVAWSRGNVIAYRIATPKPKRELQVGKWYRDMNSTWRECVLIQNKIAWLRHRPDSPAYTWESNGAARHFNRALADIDWSTPPRDEAPE